MTLEQRITALAQATGADIKALQAAVAAAGGAVTGDARLTAADPGAGWLAADGAIYPQALHPALFDRLGLISIAGFDPASWQSTALSGASSGVYCMAYGADKFVALANNSNAVFTSPDGAVWTQRTLPRTGYWRAVSYGNGVFVATAQNSNAIAVSADGVAWTERTLPTAGTWMASVYGGGVFVALRYGSAEVATSVDGNVWTSRTLPSSANWSKVVWGGGRFVAIASGSYVAATSDDGVTWTARSLPGNAHGPIAYGNGLFVVPSAAAAGTFYTSADGVTWVTRTFTPGANLGPVAFVDGVFVAPVVSSTTVATSTDGIAWSQLAGLPFAFNWTGSAYGKGVLLLSASNSAQVLRNNTRFGYDPSTHFALPTLASEPPLKWYLKT